MRTPTRSSAATWPPGSALPIDIERVDVGTSRARDGHFDRTRGAHRAPRVLRSRGGASRRDRCRRRAHERRSGRNVSAAAAARRRAARLSGMHPRAGIVVRPLHRHVARRCSRVSARAPASRFAKTRRTPIVVDSAQSHPPRAAAAARRALFAGNRRCPRSRGRYRARRRRLSRCGGARGRRAPHLADAARRGARRRRARWPSRRPSPGASIRLAQQMAAGADRFVGFDAGEAVRRFAVSKSTGQLDLPGHRVNRRGGSLVLTRSRGREKPVPAADFIVSARGAGTGGGAGSGVCDFGRLETRAVGPLGATRSGISRDAATRPSSKRGGLAAPLAVRNRRPGDTFRPLGLNGRKDAAGLLRGRENRPFRARNYARNRRFGGADCVDRRTRAGRGV